MNEITIGDKVYISAKRAAEITGYARDYVGQLCREGHVDAKMVGRSWYVYEASIRAHRFGEEAVLDVPAAKSAVEPAAAAVTPLPEPETVEELATWENPTYTAEKPDLLPEIESPRIEELLPPAEETLTDMQSAWREWFEQRQTELKTPEIESPEVLDERNASVAAAEVTETTDASDENETEEVAVPMHRVVEEEKNEPVQAQEEPEMAVQAPKWAADEEVIPIRTITAPAAPTAPQRAVVDMQVPSSYVREETVYEVPEQMPVQHGRIIHERIITKKHGKGSSYAASRAGARTRQSNAPIIALLVATSFIAIAVAAIGTGYAGRYLKTTPIKSNPVIEFLVGTREFKR